MYAEDDLLPISALQHLLFCERQCALIHVEQQWAENALTLTGRHLHEKVDGGRAQRRKRTRSTRSLMLRSLALGLYGKADVVEFGSTDVAADNAGHSGGSGTAAAPAALSAGPFPVEYKRGKPKNNRCDEVQLCAQALCLEEMLAVPVPAGAIFYGLTRRRLEVPFDPPLRELTLRSITRLHELIDRRITQLAVREKKCDRCSLIHLCLPGSLDTRHCASAYKRRSAQLSVAQSAEAGFAAASRDGFTAGGGD